MNKFQKIEDLVKNELALTHLSSGNSYYIDFLISGDAGEKEFDKEESKGNLSYDDIISDLEKSIKICGRVKHSFKTMKELEDFESNNDCGESWSTSEGFSVYKY